MVALTPAIMRQPSSTCGYLALALLAAAAAAGAAAARRPLSE